VCISQFILVSAAKSKVLKYLDDIEERLITEVGSVQEKNEEKINREKHEICQLTSILKDNKQELEFRQCLSSIELYLWMLYFH
jgi:ABC-type enterochelin transport system substrate-binding protein